MVQKGGAAERLVSEQARVVGRLVARAVMLFVQVCKQRAHNESGAGEIDELVLTIKAGLGAVESAVVGVGDAVVAANRLGVDRRRLTTVVEAAALALESHFQL